MADEPRRPAVPGATTRAARATRRELVHGELVRQIVRACHVLHHELGVGFLESVYERGLAKLLRDAGLPVERQPPLDVWFRGEVIGSFHADLLVDRRVIVELKVAKAIQPIHQAQVLNYLRCSGLRVGVVANFGPILEYKRLIL